MRFSSSRLLEAQASARMIQDLQKNLSDLAGKEKAGVARHEGAVAENVKLEARIQKLERQIDDDQTQIFKY